MYTQYHYVYIIPELTHNATPFTQYHHVYTIPPCVHNATLCVHNTPMCTQCYTMCTQYHTMCTNTKTCTQYHILRTIPAHAHLAQYHEYSTRHVLCGRSPSDYKYLTKLLRPRLYYTKLFCFFYIIQYYYIILSYLLLYYICYISCCHPVTHQDIGFESNLILFKFNKEIIKIFLINFF